MNDLPIKPQKTLFYFFEELRPKKMIFVPKTVHICIMPLTRDYKSVTAMIMFLSVGQDKGDKFHWFRISISFHSRFQFNIINFKI